VRIAKSDSMFCYPENIAGEMRRLFDGMQRERYFAELRPEEFAEKAAHFLAELNAIHPFREGNGRTQLAYLALLADKAGHPLKLEKLDPRSIMEAMIASFGGNEAPLAARRAGCEKVATGFSLESRSKLLKPITLYEFGSTRSKFIVI
jgi:cell filamentation protein